MNRDDLRYIEMFTTFAEGPYYKMPKIKWPKHSKEYKNKDANIEYYTDEKGNIRKRKKVK